MPSNHAQKPLRLFFSYAHKDEMFLEELKEHLAPLKRKGLIQDWCDREISAGQEWEISIEQNLESAEIVLLLISASFINSEYCFGKEMKQALKKHAIGQARVIPIIIRPVDWSSAPFGKLKALPKDGKPVTTWDNKDSAWTSVVKEIRKAIEVIQSKANEPHLPWSGAKSSTEKTTSVLAILQRCPDMVRLEVVAKALSCSQQYLEKDLGPLVKEKTLLIENGFCSLLNPAAFTDPPNIQDILSRTLEELLAFIEVYRREEIASSQVMNAVELAKKCADSHPRVVSGVFRTLDKLLKRRGDKHLVLDIAELSIEAAKRTTRNKEVIENEVQALICGRSWVYQRVDRLDEARVAAEKSLKLGEDILWDKNTAYCKKCIGRLYRLEAEHEESREKKKQLFLRSISCLQEAIDCFGKMREFGPEHPEVGDCYSLLGRTYLSAGQVNKADKMIQKAYKLIPEDSGKDYLDLLILSGDVAAHRGDKENAIDFYNSGLRGPKSEDAEISEIQARAYLGRAQSRKFQGMQGEAVHDFGQAAIIYESLGERKRAASARWEEACLRDSIPQEVIRLLVKEPPTVRIFALQSQKKYPHSRSAQTVARRGNVNLTRWKQLIQNAKSQDAAEDIDW